MRAQDITSIQIKDESVEHVRRRRVIARVLVADSNPLRPLALPPPAAALALS
jgi:hypothetical protein